MCILCQLKQHLAAAAADAYGYPEDEDQGFESAAEDTYFYMLAQTESGEKRLVKVRQSLESHMQRAISTDQSSSGMGSGIRNEGNTCYANSYLQVLSHTRNFADAIISERFEASAAPPFRVISHLGMILRRMSENQAIHSTMDLRRSISESFCRGEQMDAHEFAMQMLNCIQEEANKAGVWQKYRNLFHFSMKLSKQCFGCFQTRSQTMNCSDITIGPVTRDGQTVRELIENMIEGRRLEGGHRLPCDTCKDKKIGQEFIKFMETPEYLQVLVHRLSPDPVSGSVVMTNRKLSINHHISIRSESAERETITTVYTLYAVIVRRGINLQFGHYITFARNSFFDPERGVDVRLNVEDARRILENEQNSVWNYLDDTDIGQVRWYQLQNMLDKQSEIFPFMLFYKKRTYQPVDAQ